MNLGNKKIDPQGGANIPMPEAMMGYTMADIRSAVVVISKRALVLG